MGDQEKLPENKLRYEGKIW